VYRIEIHHTVAIGGIPVDRLEAENAKWLASPKWKRILRRSPLMRANAAVTAETEEIDGEFATLDEADAAAKSRAVALDGEIRNDSTVAVVRVDDEMVIGGYYPGDRGAF